MDFNNYLPSYTVPHLDFGGVGYSGMGNYHGKQTFKTFSHYKPVVETATSLEALNNKLVV